MAEINRITGIVVGQYGNAIPLTIIDKDGNAVDISAYTSISIVVRDPFHISSLSFVGGFVTDGTNGQVQFSPTAVNTFLVPGLWEGQIKLAAGAALAKTVPFILVVEESIG